MTTLTIDLPEPLISTLETHNVSKDTLNSIVQELLENWISVQFSHRPIPETGGKTRQDSAESPFGPDAIQSEPSATPTNAGQMYARQTAAEEKLGLMAQAASDQRFLADLDEVMTDFSYTDTEWWEPE